MRGIKHFTVYYGRLTLPAQQQHPGGTGNAGAQQMDRKELGQNAPPPKLSDLTLAQILGNLSVTQGWIASAAGPQLWDQLVAAAEVPGAASGPPVPVLLMRVLLRADDRAAACKLLRMCEPEELLAPALLLLKHLGTQGPTVLAPTQAKAQAKKMRKTLVWTGRCLFKAGLATDLVELLNACPKTLKRGIIAARCALQQPLLDLDRCAQVLAGLKDSVLLATMTETLRAAANSPHLTDRFCWIACLVGKMHEDSATQPRYGLMAGRIAQMLHAALAAVKNQQPPEQFTAIETQVNQVVKYLPADLADSANADSYAELASEKLDALHAAACKSLRNATGILFPHGGLNTLPENVSFEVLKEGLLAHFRTAASLGGFYPFVAADLAFQVIRKWGSEAVLGLCECLAPGWGHHLLTYVEDSSLPSETLSSEIATLLEQGGLRYADDIAEALAKDPQKITAKVVEILSKPLQGHPWLFQLFSLKQAVDFELDARLPPADSPKWESEIEGRTQLLLDRFLACDIRHPPANTAQKVVRPAAMRLIEALGVRIDPVSRRPVIPDSLSPNVDANSRQRFVTYMKLAGMCGEPYLTHAGQVFAAAIAQARDLAESWFMHFIFTICDSSVPHIGQMLGPHENELQGFLRDAAQMTETRQHMVGPISVAMFGKWLRRAGFMKAGDEFTKLMHRKMETLDFESAIEFFITLEGTREDADALRAHIARIPGPVPQAALIARLGQAVRRRTNSATARDATRLLRVLFDILFRVPHGLELQHLQLVMERLGHPPGTPIGEAIQTVCLAIQRGHVIGMAKHILEHNLELQTHEPEFVAAALEALKLTAQ